MDDLEMQHFVLHYNVPHIKNYRKIKSFTNDKQTFENRHVLGCNKKPVGPPMEMLIAFSKLTATLSTGKLAPIS